MAKKPAKKVAKKPATKVIRVKPLTREMRRALAMKANQEKR